MSTVDDVTLIIGRKPVREALDARADEIDKVLLQQGAQGEVIGAIRGAADRLEVPVQYVPEARLNRMTSGANHQGAVAVALPISYHELDDMLATIAPTLNEVQQRKPMLLALDRISDPYNFGALLRTAVASGVAGVIVPDTHMAPLNATVIKASAGAARRVPVARVGDLAERLYHMKERGYWVAGASGEAETSVWDTQWDRPTVLVMGSEGKGLRHDVAARCDYLVSIPMLGPMESLNVSVAAGILLFEAARVRL